MQRANAANCRHEVMSQGQFGQHRQSAQLPVRGFNAD